MGVDRRGEGFGAAFLPVLPLYKRKQVCGGGDPRTSKAAARALGGPGSSQSITSQNPPVSRTVRGHRAPETSRPPLPDLPQTFHGRAFL